MSLPTVNQQDQRDHRNRVSGFNIASQPNTLYIGDLSKTVTEEILHHIFSKVGKVTETQVFYRKYGNNFGYVSFETMDEAKFALNQFNFSMINGKECRIMFANIDINEKANIFVKGLNVSINHKQLYQAFELFGTILTCKICTHLNGISKGYGYVQFLNEKEAINAIENMNNTRMNGEMIKVSIFETKESRNNNNNNNRVFTNVYIKNIPLYMTHEMCKKTFIKMVNDELNRDQDDSKQEILNENENNETKGNDNEKNDYDSKNNNEDGNDSETETEKNKEKGKENENIDSKDNSDDVDGNDTEIGMNDAEKDKDKEQETDIDFENLNDVEITNSKIWINKAINAYCGCFNFKTYEQAKIAVKLINGLDITKICPKNNNNNKKEETKQSSIILFATQSIKKKTEKMKFKSGKYDGRKEEKAIARSLAPNKSVINRYRRSTFGMRCNHIARQRVYGPFSNKEMNSKYYNSSNVIPLPCFECASENRKREYFRIPKVPRKSGLIRRRRFAINNNNNSSNLTTMKDDSGDVSVITKNNNNNGNINANNTNNNVNAMATFAAPMGTGVSYSAPIANVAMVTPFANTYGLTAIGHGYPSLNLNNYNNGNNNGMNTVSSLLPQMASNNVTMTNNNNNNNNEKRRIQDGSNNAMASLMTDRVDFLQARIQPAPVLSGNNNNSNNDNIDSTPVSYHDFNTIIIDGRGLLSEIAILENWDMRKHNLKDRLLSAIHRCIEKNQIESQVIVAFGIDKNKKNNENNKYKGKYATNMIVYHFDQSEAFEYYQQFNNIRLNNLFVFSFQLSEKLFSKQKFESSVVSCNQFYYECGFNQFQTYNVPRTQSNPNFSNNNHNNNNDRIGTIIPAMKTGSNKKYSVTRLPNVNNNNNNQMHNNSINDNFYQILIDGWKFLTCDEYCHNLMRNNNDNDKISAKERMFSLLSNFIENENIKINVIIVFDSNKNMNEQNLELNQLKGYIRCNNLFCHFVNNISKYLMSSQNKYFKIGTNNAYNTLVVTSKQHLTENLLQNDVKIVNTKQFYNDYIKPIANEN